MHIKKYLIIFLALFFFPKIAGQDFYEMQIRIGRYSEQDEKALPYIRLQIEKAKNIGKENLLLKAYENGVHYSKNKEKKLQYADSCVFVAQKLNNIHQLSLSYFLRGNIKYFYFNDYKGALDNYLKSFKHLSNTRNQCLKYNIHYQIGMIKIYLGYYKEALFHFKSGITYFESEIRLHEKGRNLKEYIKGYLKNTYQASVCLRYLKKYKEADFLVQKGVLYTALTSGFSQEKKNFTLEQGILSYYKRDYVRSISFLKNTIPFFEKKKNHLEYSLANFYLAKNLIILNQPQKALNHFQKVDSVFQKEQLIFPELRENFQHLVDYYKKNEFVKEELLYNKQLLRIDSITNKDFIYLSSKIHKEYDTMPIKENHYKMKTKHKRLISVVFFSCTLILGFAFLNCIKYYREKKKKNQYKALEKKIDSNENLRREPKSKKIKFNDKTFHDIEKKLQEFEEQKGFKEKGITLNSLAKKIGTNSNYLSYVIHKKRKVTFNKYLGELRINYITEVLAHDKKYLNYTVEGLAEECGISTRQHFSNLFLEINGIRPKEFLKELRYELNDTNNKNDI